MRSVQSMNKLHTATLLCHIYKLLGVQIMGVYFLSEFSVQSYLAEHGTASEIMKIVTLHCVSTYYVGFSFGQQKFHFVLYVILPSVQFDENISTQISMN